MHDWAGIVTQHLRVKFRSRSCRCPDASLQSPASRKRGNALRTLTRLTLNEVVSSALERATATRRPTAIQQFAAYLIINFIYNILFFEWTRSRWVSVKMSPKRLLYNNFFRTSAPAGRFSPLIETNEHLSRALFCLWRQSCLQFAGAGTRR